MAIKLGLDSRNCIFLYGKSQQVQNTNNKEFKCSVMKQNKEKQSKQKEEEEECEYK